MMKKILLAILTTVCVGIGISHASGPQITYNFVQGLNYAGLKEYPKALEFFTAEIEKHSSNGYAYAWRAKMYAEMGNYADAMTDVNRAIAKMPKKDKIYRGFAHNLRGHLYMKSGNSEGAVQEFTTAIGCLPDVGEAYVGRAEAHVALHHYHEAIIDLITAIDSGYVADVPRVVRLLGSSAGQQQLEAMPEYGLLIEKLSGGAE